MDNQFKKEIETCLSRKSSKVIQISSFQSVGGGCINESFRINTTIGSYFIKWNDKDRYPSMFAAEAKGLMLLEESGAHVPKIIAQQEYNYTSFLILEWIESGERKQNFWREFGIRLANLHLHSQEKFGLDHDNYIGSLKQSNKQHGTWKEFFVEERLKPQIQLAFKSGLFDTAILSKFDVLFEKLNQLIQEEKPALLHGDLWNGNYLVNENGYEILIDPAVYYGHREMDLAMTKLFGGFNQEFYAAYDETFPLQSGFEHRVDLHNLYPLLVHVNLFGGSYMSQVKNILNYYSG